MSPQKYTARTFIVDGKTYASLAELAREAGITYNAAVKRQQRGFLDFEIFYGKYKAPKVINVKKRREGRSVNINGKHYESIKAAHEVIQPKASYNTVKKTHH